MLYVGPSCIFHNSIKNIAEKMIWNTDIEDRMIGMVANTRSVKIFIVYAYF